MLRCAARPVQSLKALTVSFQEDIMAFGALIGPLVQAGIGAATSAIGGGKGGGKGPKADEGGGAPAGGPGGAAPAAPKAEKKKKGDGNAYLEQLKQELTTATTPQQADQIGAKV